MEGHSHCAGKSSPKDLHEKCPPSTSIPPLSPTFRLLPAQKAFLKTSVQRWCRTHNQTTLFCCLSLGMDGRQLPTSRGHETSAKQSEEALTFGRSGAHPRAA